MLFNLYFSAVVHEWRSGCVSAGIPVAYRLGRKLVGDRTAKSRLSCCSVTESQFADDAAIYTQSGEDMGAAGSSFVATASRFGLTVIFTKTKAMVVNAPSPPSGLLELPEGSIELVPGFYVSRQLYFLGWPEDC